EPVGRKPHDWQRLGSQVESPLKLAGMYGSSLPDEPSRCQATAENCGGIALRRSLTAAAREIHRWKQRPGRTLSRHAVRRFSLLRRVSSIIGTAAAAGSEPSLTSSAVEDPSLMANVVVVGSQWGDEGKGKIVDWLSEQ